MNKSEIIAFEAQLIGQEIEQLENLIQKHIGAIGLAGYTNRTERETVLASRIQNNQKKIEELVDERSQLNRV